MSEMAVTATELIVVGRGKLVAAGSVADLIRRASGSAVLVRTREVERLAAALTGAARSVERLEPDTVSVTGMDSEEIGLVAAREAIALIELTPQQATLEEAFMEITRDAVEYHGVPASGLAASGPMGRGQR
jgi:ABC-2 type transport system ATP-binding protein